MGDFTELQFFDRSSILKNLEFCINNKKPFSLIRFGDGALKLIHAILFKDIPLINHIVSKEGIPEDKLLDIMQMYGYYARRANFIDSPEIYFSNKSWNRFRVGKTPISNGTLEKIKRWKFYYSQAEFDNNNFCHPDINFISLLSMKNQKDLLNIISKKRICVITSCENLKNKLTRHCEVDIIPIVGFYGNQYLNNYENVTKKIKTCSCDYDLWLVAAGELGRIYIGMIKEMGGRAFDLGSAVDYWSSGKITNRLLAIMRPKRNGLGLILTSYGRLFERYL